MNEAEWLSSEDPQAMLDGLKCLQHALGSNHHTPSDRKLRLFAVACCRQRWYLLTDERSRKAVEVAERYVDGKGSEEELEKSHQLAYDAWGESQPTSNPAGMARYATVNTRHISHAVSAMTRPGLQGVDANAQAAFLREIVGNPWHPIELERVIRCERCGGLRSRAEQFICADRSCNGLMQDKYPWLTPTVLSLAEAAYEERARVWKGRKHDHDEETGWQDADHLDPDRLGVLADALEDAGAEEEIVRHLRGEERIMTCKRCGKTDTINCHCNTPKWITKRSPCVRGCHVIDAILGKE